MKRKLELNTKSHRHRMEPKLSIIASLILLLLFLNQSQLIIAKSPSRKTQPTKHGEVYRAKIQIDSLIYKLTLDLNTSNEKKNLATVMQKDAEKLSRIAEDEIALLKPVQRLLDQLVKGNASGGNQSCFCGIRGGKTAINIATKSSPLPKHYTITVQGK